MFHFIRDSLTLDTNVKTADSLRAVERVKLEFEYYYFTPLPTPPHPSLYPKNTQSLTNVIRHISSQDSPMLGRGWAGCIGSAEGRST